MRAVIIAGGTIKDYSFTSKYIKPDDYIICADSGYDHARGINIQPDLLVGDMDSIKSHIGIKHVKVFSVKKDYTDTEIAIKAAVEQGCKEILILGAIGNRMDHTVANILLLKRLYGDGIKAIIADEHNEIMAAGDSITVEGKAGDLVSIIPVTDCHRVSTSGLEYQLKNDSLFLGTARGISNVMLGDIATINIETGFALIMKCND